jgi:crotonobetainyl-CoA:carnitine CoA-transferase CaiB-like acyl-CoA transferase
MVADVTVENFRPGAMKRLGLSPGALISANPDLIVCSIPGFAGDDAPAGVYAHEGVLGAAAGLYASRDGDPSEPPIFTTLLLASSFAALIAPTALWPR